ncbi:MAG: DUF2786 domain-containing protein [Bifidobacterium sp.]|jgi:hypothetical protein|uniref:DUF2786 domain-containing protein n=1 Tax=Bifidobacterium sp. TaxID=41200 RepID=UPI0039EBE4BF
MSEETDLSRVLERARRLLAIARDPGASDNEQRLAFERAQKLMDAHAIEEWMLEREHQRPAPVVGERLIRFEESPVNRWRKDLAMIVARGNRCQTVWHRSTRGNGRKVVTGVTLYGTDADIRFAISLLEVMEDSRSVSWRIRARSTPNAKASAAFRNGYYQGFNDEIAERYQRLREGMQSRSSGRDLILARGRQVDAYIEEHVELTPGRVRLPKMARASKPAYRQGRQAGSIQPLGLDEVRESTGARTLAGGAR